MDSVALDIVLVLIVIWGLASGVFSGALLEIFSMIGVVIGVFLASRTYFIPILFLKFFSNKIDAVVAFTLILLITILIFFTIGRLLRKYLKLIYIGFVDRFFGLIFGFIKGSITSAVIVVILSSFNLTKNWTENSKVAPLLIKELKVLKGLLPRDISVMIQWKNPYERHPD